MSLIGPIANHTNDAQSFQALPTDYSDDSLALWFAQKHAHDLRYVARKRLWYLWNAKRWREDDTLRIPDEVRRICRAAADACGDPKIATAGKIAAVERLAKSDRRLAATVDQWDANRWLLNTPAGAVDLGTGKLRPHLSEDYCTKTTAVSPGGECPLWKGFLEQTFGGDAELICFVQRVCGYALTGATHEHALFFCYGTGANGKGTLIKTVVDILGDYARVAPVETFTASSTDRHPTELAMLMGARLVSAQETEEGRSWAEAKIKAITGGDPITARRMRQDFFTFTPQLKLIIAGNHRPRVQSVDEAIRRRIHIIPFSVTIPADQRDPGLGEKLKPEWPGILSWMIEGCLLWQKQGLSPPAVVRDATLQYLDAEDVTQLWLDECCEQDPDAWESSAKLFGSWKAWATRNGEAPRSMRRLAQALEAKGFKIKRTNTARGFIRVRVKAGPCA